MARESDRGAGTGAGERWGRDEGFALVRAWERSGESRSAFCRRRGVPRGRLVYWARRLEQERKGQSDGFFALTVAEPPTSKPERVEVSLGPKMTVRIPVASDRERFVETIRWLLEAVDA